MTSNLYNGITERLFYTVGKRPENSTPRDFYMALCYAVRDQMMAYNLAESKPQKEVAYLSAEFLIGPQLGNNLLNLGLTEEAEKALNEPPDTVISPTTKLVVASLDVNVNAIEESLDVSPSLTVLLVIVIVGAVPSYVQLN